MKWETVKLGDIATCIQPGPFGSQLHNSDYSETGTPLIMPKDMINGHISHTNLIYVGDEHVSRLSRHQVHKGNIMVARKGDVRKCVFITEKEDGWMTGSDCLKVALNEEVCFPKFIYYQLRSPFIGKWLETISIGATMPSLNTGLLSGIEVFLPPITVQKTISDILSAYDNLIENNQKQIKLLEEAAQRLYKEWFIDLRFPGYETTPIHDGVPEGWEKTSLEEVISFNPKYVLPKEGEKRVFPMAALNTSSMILDWSQSELSTSTSGTKFSNGDTLLARITPCLENGKTAFVDGLLDGEVATGSTEFIVMQSKAISPYMVYLLARSSDFRETAVNSMTGSDGRQRAQVDKLKQYPYLRPSQLIIDQFGTFAAPVFMQIRGLNKQNSDLQEARDRLVPKLMSRKIEV